MEDRVSMDEESSFGFFSTYHRNILYILYCGVYQTEVCVPRRVEPSEKKNRTHRTGTFYSFGVLYEWS
jgi:hypothetical protein